MPPTTTPSDTSDVLGTTDEIKFAFQNMKRENALGEDSIVTDLLIDAGVELHKRLARSSATDGSVWKRVASHCMGEYDI